MIMFTNHNNDGDMAAAFSLCIEIFHKSSFNNVS